jgi:hypothetical protein
MARRAGIRQWRQLALGADRLPALALEPVAAVLRTAHGPWTAAQGFQQVWFVGPDVRLTWRLDP